MIDRASNWLTGMGLSPEITSVLIHTAAFLLVILVAVIAYQVVRRYLLRVLRALVGRTRTNWDDILLSEGVFNRACKLVPAIVIHRLAPVALHDAPALIEITRTAVAVYMLFMGLLVIDAVLNGALTIYGRNYPDLSRRFPLKGFVQVAKLIVVLVGVILVLSTLLGRSPIVFFSGLGAMTAVLMLIFKDAILGFVAGIQLTANHMVAVGDWIQMDKYGADGDVVDVTLTTVKVRNWDKTISTVPTYALISDSFKNWRGMQESGGRRIKRSISIDMSTVRICDDAMIERFRKFDYISEYIERKQTELADWNRERGYAPGSELINGRRLTNVGTFRAYIAAYLRNHPMVHQDMTFLVRHLQPTDKGLPIEVYVFSKDQRWAHYEGIQADIFDHIIAVVPEFGLRVFQSPAGTDIARAVGRVSREPDFTSSTRPPE